MKMPVALFCLVAGSNQARVVAKILGGEFDPGRYSAQGVRLLNGGLLWLSDRDAARKLRRGNNDHTHS